MNITATLAICIVFGGCCSNVVLFELIVNEDPGAGNLTTFLQLLKAPRETHEDATEEEKLKFIDWLWWCVGIAILTFALFVSARMGIFQESLYSKFRKHPWEALYYTHLLPLVLWLPTVSNLIKHMNMALDTPDMILLGVTLPQQVIRLILFVVTQGLCIRAVYVLTTECASLVVTLTVTLRKFVSLLFSIMYFKNPFTLGHWIGTLLVFIGTMIFTELLQKCVSLFVPVSDKNKVQ